MDIYGVNPNNRSSSAAGTSEVNAFSHVNLSPVMGNDIAGHIGNIKQLRSPNDIANYVDQHIKQYFLNTTPPSPSEGDQVIVNLINTLSKENSQLAAITYHAIDQNDNLKVLNTDVPRQRQISLRRTTIGISDNFFQQLALASKDPVRYANAYFGSSAPPFSNGTVPVPPTPGNLHNTVPTDSSVTSTKTTKTEEPNPVDSLSEEIINYLPVDFDLDKLKPETIDIRTGKELREKDFDLDTERGRKRYEEAKERSITIYTGRNEGVADEANQAKIANALIDYIKNPYSNNISEDGLEEILEGLTMEFAADIMLYVEEELQNSDNPQHIRNLHKLEGKTKGLDGVIAELYEHNLNGGNNGDPTSFLNKTFPNDSEYRLNGKNIVEISDELTEQLEAFLDADEDERDGIELIFIRDTLKALYEGHSDNMDKGHIETLLQTIAEKTNGDDKEIRAILSDITTDAGISTQETVTSQTGYTLTLHFGEYTFMDDEGKEFTFSNDEITGSEFNKVKDYIEKVFLGTHSSVKDLDLETQAVISEEAADMFNFLSKKQQDELIKEFKDSDSDIDPEHLRNLSFLADNSESQLLEIANKMEESQGIEDLQKEGLSITDKAKNFSKLVLNFDSKTDFSEMSYPVESLVDNGGFLRLTTDLEILEFRDELITELQDKGVSESEIDTINENLARALSLQKITFKSTADGSDVTPSKILLEMNGNYYLNIIEDDGTLTNALAIDFLENLSDEDLADPELFDSLLEKSFTDDEFKRLEDSLIQILTALDEQPRDNKWNTLRSNLTDALLEFEHDEELIIQHLLTNEKDGKLSLVGFGEDPPTYEILLDNLDVNSFAENDEFIDFIINDLSGSENIYNISDVLENKNTNQAAAFINYILNESAYRDSATSEALETKIEEKLLEKTEGIEIKDLAVDETATADEAETAYDQILAVSDGEVTSENIDELSDALAAMLKGGKTIDDIRVTMGHENADDNTAYELLALAIVKATDDLGSKEANTRKLIEYMDALAGKIEHRERDKDFVYHVGRAMYAEGKKDQYEYDDIWHHIVNDSKYGRTRKGIKKKEDNFRKETMSAFNAGYKGQDRSRATQHSVYVPEGNQDVRSKEGILQQSENIVTLLEQGKNMSYIMKNYFGSDNPDDTTYYEVLAHSIIMYAKDQTEPTAALRTKMTEVAQKIDSRDNDKKFVNAMGYLLKQLEEEGTISSETFNAGDIAYEIENNSAYGRNRSGVKKRKAEFRRETRDAFRRGYNDSKNEFGSKLFPSS